MKPLLFFCISRVFFNDEVTEPAHDCRYLGIQIVSNRIFLDNLNIVWNKMPNAIRSLYLVRKTNCLNSKIFSNQFYSSLSGILLLTLTAINRNRVNKQIDWGIKSCHVRQNFIIPLISLKIVACQPNYWSRKLKLNETSNRYQTLGNIRKFQMFTSCLKVGQNKRTNQSFIKRERKQSGVRRLWA